jgi:DNA-binding transcriptional LysR family regulator
MIDLRLLTHALALAENGSFAKAARAVHLSQPALSRSIQTLEGQLGVTLFERGKNGVIPTTVGQLVLLRARSLATQSTELEREIGVLQAGGGMRLRVAAGPYPAQFLVAGAIARCLAAAPEFRASLEISAWFHVIESVRARRADIGICEVSDLEAPELEILPLRCRQGHAVARRGHPLAGRAGLGTGDLVAYPMILTSRVPPRLLGQLLPPGSRNPPPQIACEHLGITLDLLKSSNAFSFFPEVMIRRELAGGELVLLDFSPGWLHSAFHLVRLKEPGKSPAAQLFWQALLETDAATA